MPKIREYDLQTQGSAPVAGKRIEGSSIDVGRGLMAAGQGMQELGQGMAIRDEQADISLVNAEIAKRQAEQSNKWQETLKSADPNDREVGSKFIEQFDESFADLGDKVSTSAGRRHLGDMTARLRAHMSETVMQGQAELAGFAAKENIKSTISNFSSSLLNDPSSFNQSLELFHQGVDAQVASGAIPAYAAEAIKRDGAGALAKSTIRGWTSLDPEGAKKQLSEGRWDQYLDGDQKHQMIGEADQTMRAREMEKEHLQRMQEKARAERQRVTQNQFITKMVDGALSPRDIIESNLEPFGSGSKEQFLGLLKSSSKNKLETDGATFQSLFERIHLPEGDPNKIVDENQLNEYVGKGLDFTALNQLRSEVQGKNTSQGGIESDLKRQLMDVAKGQLTKSNALTGIRDPQGDEQLLKFNTFFLTEYEAQRKQGKTAIQLLDPSSPDYLGKQLARFSRSQEQIMRDMAKNVRGPQPSQTPEPLPTPNPNAFTRPKPVVEGRKPGESAADYLKRISKGNG